MRNQTVATRTEHLSPMVLRQSELHVTVLGIDQKFSITLTYSIKISNYLTDLRTKIEYI